MVPVVVAKFQTKNTFNGATVAQLVIDSFPPAPPGVDQTAWESQPGAWVQTIDLLGSSTTVQKAQIKSIARPVTAQAQEALQWVLSKLPWLSASKRGIPYQDINAPLYDLPHITLDSILTVIDANDPLNDPDQNPNNITLPGCPQLVYELVSHSFPPWLQQDPNDLDVAKVLITALLKYSGTDPETMAVFTFNPTSPKTPTAPGAGYVPLIYGCRVTNAATNSYTQLTSSQAGEPVPQGYAQYLYGCLSQLFQQGTLTIIEQECSDLLPPGCTFNAVDGLAEWQTMQALVLAVDEDIENGTTKVTFGPPIHLGLDTREELFRANLGRLPSYKLQQRTSGLLEGGSNVVGAEHAAVSESSTAPQPISVQLGPFQVQSRANPADISGNTFQVKVTLNGKFLNVDASNVTVNKPSNSDADGWTNLNANDTLWFDGPVAAGACPTVNIKSYGNGDNSYSGGGYWVGGGLTESDGATPPNQTVLRKVIAVFVADSKGRPSLQTQQTTTNLQMQNTAFSWRPALYPGPT